MTSIRDTMFYEIEDEWRLFDDDAWARLCESSSDDSSRWLRWQVPPEALVAVRKLRCRADSAAEPPPQLPHFTHLEELSMPARWLTHLRTETVPPKLRLLGLRDKASPKWPEALVLPGLESLVYVEGPLRISPDQTPNLRGLAIELGKKSLTPPESIAGWKRLRALHLTTVNDESALGVLPLTRLEHLALVGGKVASIQPLEGSALRSITLKNLSKLGSLRSLAAVPDLEDLDFQYCKHITDLDALLSIPKLRRITFTGCGKIGLGKIFDALKAKCPGNPYSAPGAPGASAGGTT